MICQSRPWSRAWSDSIFAHETVSCAEILSDHALTSNPQALDVLQSDKSALNGFWIHDCL